MNDCLQLNRSRSHNLHKTGCRKMVGGYFDLATKQPQNNMLTQRHAKNTLAEHFSNCVVITPKSPTSHLIFKNLVSTSTYHYEIVFEKSTIHNNIDLCFFIVNLLTAQLYVKDFILFFTRKLKECCSYAHSLESIFRSVTHETNGYTMFRITLKEFYCTLLFGKWVNEKMHCSHGINFSGIFHR